MSIRGPWGWVFAK